MLQRLASTTRWTDLEAKFGIFASQMSEVFWDMVKNFTDTNESLLYLRGAFLRSRASAYANAIAEAGAPLPRCVGFIDCTKIKISRPGGHGSLQRSVYSGHKRMHCLIYQTLTTPDGLMFPLYGPEVGRRHDLTLFRQSQWDATLQSSLTIGDEQYYIYGDLAYVLRPWMVCPYYTARATPEQQMFNLAMSAVRVSVEHNYKDLKQFWTSQDFARNLHVCKAPIALLYKSCALLLNIHACLYKRGQEEETFQVTPPSLEEYLHQV